MPRTRNTEADDRRLADRVRAGDRDALGELYDRHAAGIYDFAVRTLRDSDRAADVVRVAFERAWRELHADPPPDDVVGLLYATARRAAMAEIDDPSAGAGRSVKTSELSDAGGAGRELGKTAWSVAASLDPEDYTLLDLHLRRGMDTDELADAFGLPAGPVARRLARLRRRFEAAVFTRVMSKRKSLSCADLHAILDGAGRVDAGLEQAVADHIDSCEICSRSRDDLASADRFAALRDVRLGDDVADGVWQGVETDIDRPSLDPIATFRRADVDEEPEEEEEERPRRVAVVVEETIDDLEPVPEEPEPIIERRRRRSILALVAAMVLVLAAVGVTLALRQESGGGLDPTDVRSASHQVGRPSSLRVIRVAWTPPEGAVGYSIRWSPGPDDLPDQVVDLPAAQTGTESPVLEPDTWYFHLRTRGEDGSWTSTVHLGPFPIVDEAQPSPPPSGSPVPGSPGPSASPGASSAATAAPRTQGRVSTPPRTSQAPASQAPAPPVPRMTIQDASANEGNAGSVDMIFRVNLSRTTTRTVTVRYQARAGSATSGNDFAPVSGTLSIPAGSTSRTIGVPVYGDEEDEPNEQFTLELSSESGAAVDRRTANGTIVDDDAPPTLSIGDASDDEGNNPILSPGQLTFTITLSRASSRAVTVQWATANGTAQAPSDYTAVPPTTVTFNPGETSKAVIVEIVEDTTPEPDETMFVNLSNPGSATIADGQGQGTIRNDDD